MKFLLTKRFYYRLTRIFNSYNRKIQYQEKNQSVLVLDDKRLMNLLFYEKNSSRNHYYSKNSDLDPRKERFVRYRICLCSVLLIKIKQKLIDY